MVGLGEALQVSRRVHALGRFANRLVREVSDMYFRYRAHTCKTRPERRGRGYWLRLENLSVRAVANHPSPNLSAISVGRTPRYRFWDLSPQLDSGDVQYRQRYRDGCKARYLRPPHGDSPPVDPSVEQVDRQHR